MNTTPMNTTPMNTTPMNTTPWAEQSTVQARRINLSNKQCELIPALTIVFHPDWERIGERAYLSGLLKNREIELSRNSPDFHDIRTIGSVSRSLSDIYISRKPVIFHPLKNNGCQISWDQQGSGMTVDGRELDDSILLSIKSIQKGVVLTLANRIVLMLHMVPDNTAKPISTFGMAGNNYQLLNICHAVEQVAPLNVSVLIRGATGVGKELVANAIHSASRRHNEAFISVNMAAIPPTLAASELFGSNKGAFSGAIKEQPGYFQKADKGSLFLDEIGETPREIQVQLLRALQTCEIQVVGGSFKKVDVRFITATDADLEGKIYDQSFSSALLYRLCNFEVTVPELRYRRDDIGLLLRHFLANELTMVGESWRMDLCHDEYQIFCWVQLFTEFCRYDWPGNIRQLRSVIRQLVVSNQKEKHFSLSESMKQLLFIEHSGEPSTDIPVALEDGVKPYRKPDEVDDGELLQGLQQCRWDLKNTAKALNISRASLYKLIEKCPTVRKAGDIPLAELEDSFSCCEGNLDAMVDQLQVSKAALKRRLNELTLEIT